MAWPLADDECNGRNNKWNVWGRIKRFKLVDNIKLERRFSKKIHGKQKKMEGQTYQQPKRRTMMRKNKDETRGGTRRNIVKK